MAIIIDLTDRFQNTPPQVEPVPSPATREANPADTIALIDEPFGACKHRSIQLDPKQRTVKCGACGIWLDPVWCLEQFYRWNRQLDHRLAEIKEHEERVREREKRRSQRAERSAPYLRKRRTDELERAAHNEYRARQLALMADRQRQRAQQIDDELGESVTADVEAAAARTRITGLS
jgi:hypothetical protein